MDIFTSDYLTITDVLKGVIGNQFVLALTIIAATFVLEDATTVTAALLTANGTVPWGLALGALYVGIFVGDLGLYGLGRLARTNKRAATWIGDARIAKGQAWLSDRLTSSLIAARCVPGLRLPVYSASGYLAVSIIRFTVVAAIAAAVWTPVLFFTVLIFGETVLAELGPLKYLVGIILILTIVTGPWIAARLSRGKA